MMNETSTSNKESPDKSSTRSNSSGIGKKKMGSLFQKIVSQLQTSSITKSFTSFVDKTTGFITTKPTNKSDNPKKKQMGSEFLAVVTGGLTTIKPVFPKVNNNENEGPGPQAMLNNRSSMSGLPQLPPHHQFHPSMLPSHGSTNSLQYPVPGSNPSGNGSSSMGSYNSVAPFSMMGQQPPHDNFPSSSIPSQLSSQLPNPPTNSQDHAKAQQAALYNNAFVSSGSNKGSIHGGLGNNSMMMGMQGSSNSLNMFPHQKPRSAGMDQQFHPIPDQNTMKSSVSPADAGDAFASKFFNENTPAPAKDMSKSGKFMSHEQLVIHQQKIIAQLQEQLQQFSGGGPNKTPTPGGFPPKSPDPSGPTLDMNGGLSGADNRPGSSSMHSTSSSYLKSNMGMQPGSQNGSQNLPMVPPHQQLGYDRPKMSNSNMNNSYLGMMGMSGVSPSGSDLRSLMGGPSSSMNPNPVSGGVPLPGIPNMTQSASSVQAQLLQKQNMQKLQNPQSQFDPSSDSFPPPTGGVMDQYQMMQMQQKSGTDQNKKSTPVAPEPSRDRPKRRSSKAVTGKSKAQRRNSSSSVKSDGNRGDNILSNQLSSLTAAESSLMVDPGPGQVMNGFQLPPLPNLGSSDIGGLSPALEGLNAKDEGPKITSKGNNDLDEQRGSHRSNDDKSNHNYTDEDEELLDLYTNNHDDGLCAEYPYNSCTSIMGDDENYGLCNITGNEEKQEFTTTHNDRVTVDAEDNVPVTTCKIGEEQHEKFDNYSGFDMSSNSHLNKACPYTLTSCLNTSTLNNNCDEVSLQHQTTTHKQQEENNNTTYNTEHEEGTSPISEQTFNNFHSLQEANKITFNLSQKLPELPVSQFINVKTLNHLQGDVLQPIRYKERYLKETALSPDIKNINLISNIDSGNVHTTENMKMIPIFIMRRKPDYISLISERKNIEKANQFPKLKKRIPLNEQYKMSVKFQDNHNEKEEHDGVEIVGIHEYIIVRAEYHCFYSHSYDTIDVLLCVEDFVKKLKIYDSFSDTYREKTSRSLSPATCPNLIYMLVNDTSNEDKVLYFQTMNIEVAGRLTRQNSYSWIRLRYSSENKSKKVTNICLAAISKTIIYGASSLSLSLSPTFISEGDKYHICTVTLSGTVIIKSTKSNGKKYDFVLNHDYEIEDDDNQEEQEHDCETESEFWDAEEEAEKYNYVCVNISSKFIGQCYHKPIHTTKVFILAADAARYVDLKMNDSGFVETRNRKFNFPNVTDYEQKREDEIRRRGIGDMKDVEKQSELTENEWDAKKEVGQYKRVVTDGKKFRAQMLIGRKLYYERFVLAADAARWTDSKIREVGLRNMTHLRKLNFESETDYERAREDEISRRGIIGMVDEEKIDYLGEIDDEDTADQEEELDTNNEEEKCMSRRRNGQRQSPRREGESSRDRKRRHDRDRSRKMRKRLRLNIIVAQEQRDRHARQERERLNRMSSVERDANHLMNNGDNEEPEREKQNLTPV